MKCERHKNCTIEFDSIQGCPICAELECKDEEINNLNSERKELTADVADREDNLDHARVAWEELNEIFA